MLSSVKLVNSLEDTKPVWEFSRRTHCCVVIIHLGDLFCGGRERSVLRLRQIQNIAANLQCPGFQGVEASVTGAMDAPGLRQLCHLAFRNLHLEIRI